MKRITLRATLPGRRAATRWQTGAMSVETPDPTSSGAAPRRRRGPRVLRIAGGLLAAALAAIGALVLLATDAAPALPAPAAVAPGDIDRALALVRANDPRRAPPGLLRATVIGARDAELLLQQALRRRGGDGRIAIGVAAGRADLTLAWPLPLGRWLNLRASLETGRPLPALVRLRAGAVPLPAAGVWLPALARQVARQQGLPPQLLAASAFVQGVGFAPARVTVVWALPADARERLWDAVLPAAERKAVRAYGATLAALDAGAVPGTVRSMAELIPPLFRQAAERSLGGGSAAAAAENRAALVALVLYTNRRAIDLLMPQATDGLPAQPLPVMLYGREDHPRHFLISAAIAADAGGALADAVGVWKEIDDARRGSGFSFDDLVADRAGTRFGERAVRDPHGLQEQLAQGAREEDLMPRADGLPSFLPEAEFRRRYGSVGSPAYRAVADEVERRVAALPLLRGP